MENRRNYYRILQVQPDAPKEIIRASYHTLMKDLKQHPDLGGDNWNASILNEAYEILSNSSKRAEYNKVFFKNYTENNHLHKNSCKKPDAVHKCKMYRNSMDGTSNSGDNCFNSERPVSNSAEQSNHNAHRRSINRIKSNGKIRYHLSSSFPGRDAALIDLSPKGVRFLCTEKLKEESTLKIESPLFDAKAEVTFTKVNDANGQICYVVGASFLNVAFHNKRGSFYSNFI